MDNDFPVDMAEVLDAVNSADVISIFFPMLRRVLLVDTRHDAFEGPMVRVAPMVNSMDERVRSLRRMRPRFGPPDQVRLVPWPKHVASLDDLGVIEVLVSRLESLGYSERLPDLRRSLDELRMMEQAELIAAVTGENFESLWERNPRHEGHE